MSVTTWDEWVATARILMGTEAHHKLGDISREKPAYFLVESEDAANYYGQWLTGFGFIGVRFPKATAREMTDEERKFLIDRPVGLA